MAENIVVPPAAPVHRRRHSGRHHRGPKWQRGLRRLFRHRKQAVLTVIFVFIAIAAGAGVSLIARDHVPMDVDRLQNQ